ncbi:MAG: MotA/TolQ/ExbB proton channel family protein [Fibrobacter sp.]|nr:MotA/TolQ/ExbB proton channel family protein [Fibrobacter sp.]
MQRQKQVDQKNSSQQSIDKKQGEIERLYGEIARVREEILIRENSLNSAKADFEQIKEQFKGIANVTETILNKEKDATQAAFPINQQNRTLRIQRIMGEVKNKPEKVVVHLRNLQNYFLENFKQQVSCDINRETILLSDNSLRETPVIRLGTTIAFGMSDSGRSYYLGYTANNLKSPFEWIEMTDKQASQNLALSMPKWFKTSIIEGDLYVDVLQNKFSSELLGLERKTTVAIITDYFKAGGIVMIPLGLICLWALILLFNRIVVYSMAHSRDNRFIDEAIEYLNQKKDEDAQKLASRSKGVLARILNTCLKHSKWKRPVAEKAVKELLLAEIPSLDKHLDTLAVLAGAAPLLGLLGTVTGMIRMFESITRFGTGDPKLLAGGISEALITTEVGLTIAIPVLLIHNFLRNRRNRIQADMEMYAMRILNRSGLKNKG